MLLNVLECKGQSPQPRIIQSKVSGLPRLINPTQGRFSAIRCVDHWGFPGGPMVQNPPLTQGARDRSSIPGLGRAPAGRHGNPRQYSCLENPRDRGAWWATVQGDHKELAATKYLSAQACICICLADSLCCALEVNTTL